MQAQTGGCWREGQPAGGSAITNISPRHAKEINLHRHANPVQRGIGVGWGAGVWPGETFVGRVDRVGKRWQGLDINQRSLARDAETKIGLHWNLTRDLSTD